jgi:FtsH-binding integral membrane protein
MTKWARMRRRKERRRAEASKDSAFVESETKLAEPEKVSDNVKHHQETQKTETTKTSKSNSLPFQIPKYVYLVAIFTLLSGVFFPMITPGAEKAFNFVIGGTATLFLGLAGGILLFKATTSNKRRGILLVIGIVLIAISLALIFLIQELWKIEFIRS